MLTYKVKSLIILKEILFNEKIMQKKQFKILVFGEVLFDIYPQANKQHLGGAPFNYMFHLHSFGCKINLITKIGNDELGNEILKKIKHYNISTKYIDIDPSNETGKVIVNLNKNKIPDYNIKPNVAYDYINTNVANINQYDLLYFGTLAQRNKVSKTTLLKILHSSDNTLKFYDINLRQNFYSKEIISTSLKYADILKLNEDEFKTVCLLFNYDGFNEIENLKMLSKNFNIKYICITYGAKGSALYTDNKYNKYVLQKQNNIVDTVGAGDAFSAMLTLGILNNQNENEILKSASEYALEICQINGAIKEGVLSER